MASLMIDIPDFSRFEKIERDRYRIAASAILLATLPERIMFSIGLIRHLMRVKKVLNKANAAQLLEGLDERGKMEAYADLSYAADIFENVQTTLESRVNSRVSVPFIHFIVNMSRSLLKKYRQLEQEAYPIAYPDSPDFESPEYIKMIHDFHNNGNAAICS